MKAKIRLNIDALEAERKKRGWVSNEEFSKVVGCSTTQLWRLTRPVDHESYNAPGADFIAGAMSAFDAPFEKFFFLDKPLRTRNTASGELEEAG